MQGLKKKKKVYIYKNMQSIVWLEMLSIKYDWAGVIL